MRKLPSHTTRYWAEQAYRAVTQYGLEIKTHRYTTVQGVEIKVQYDPREKDILISWEHEGKTIRKLEKIRKNWNHF